MPTMVIVGGVGSQASAECWITAVLDFVKAFDSHRIGLKELFDDVVVSIVECITQICSSKSGETAHAIDEKLWVSDAVGLFQLVEELFSRIAASMP